ACSLYALGHAVQTVIGELRLGACNEQAVHRERREAVDGAHGEHRAPYRVAEGERDEAYRALRLAQLTEPVVVVRLRARGEWHRDRRRKPLLDAARVVAESHRAARAAHPGGVRVAGLRR